MGSEIGLLGPLLDDLWVHLQAWKLVDLEARFVRQNQAPKAQSAGEITERAIASPMDLSVQLQTTKRALCNTQLWLNA